MRHFVSRRRGEGWLCTMRHIALEGRCWVLGSGTLLRASDVPDDFPGRTQLFPDPDEWTNDGDSVVVDPQGKIVAGPMRREEGILYADIDVARVAPARRTLDVTGHYARPDIFALRVLHTPVHLYAVPIRDLGILHGALPDHARVFLRHINNTP